MTVETLKWETGNHNIETMVGVLSSPQFRRHPIGTQVWDQRGFPPAMAGKTISECIQSHVPWMFEGWLDGSESYMGFNLYSIYYGVNPKWNPHMSSVKKQLVYFLNSGVLLTY